MEGKKRGQWKECRIALEAKFLLLDPNSPDSRHPSPPESMFKVKDRDSSSLSMLDWARSSSGSIDFSKRGLTS